MSSTFRIGTRGLTQPPNAEDRLAAIHRKVENRGCYATEIEHYLHQQPEGKVSAPLSLTDIDYVTDSRFETYVTTRGM